MAALTSRFGVQSGGRGACMNERGARVGRAHPCAGQGPRVLPRAAAHPRRGGAGASLGSTGPRAGPAHCATACFQRALVAPVLTPRPQSLVLNVLDELTVAHAPKGGTPPKEYNFDQVCLEGEDPHLQLLTCAMGRFRLPERELERRGWCVLRWLTLWVQVLSPQGGQEQAFEDVRQLVQAAVDGYNANVVAYGATGSGKTHTLWGGSADPGLVPRAVNELFRVRPGAKGAAALPAAHASCVGGCVRSLADRVPCATVPRVQIIQRDAGKFSFTVAFNMLDLHQVRAAHGASCVRASLFPGGRKQRLTRGWCAKSTKSSLIMSVQDSLVDLLAPKGKEAKLEVKKDPKGMVVVTGATLVQVRPLRTRQPCGARTCARLSSQRCAVRLSFAPRAPPAGVQLQGHAGGGGRGAAAARAAGPRRVALAPGAERAARHDQLADAELGARQAVVRGAGRQRAAGRVPGGSGAGARGARGGPGVHPLPRPQAHAAAQRRAGRQRQDAAGGHRQPGRGGGGPGGEHARVRVARAHHPGAWWCVGAERRGSAVAFWWHWGRECCDAGVNERGAVCSCCAGRRTRRARTRATRRCSGSRSSWTTGRSRRACRRTCGSRWTWWTSRTGGRATRPRCRRPSDPRGTAGAWAGGSCTYRRTRD